MKKISSLIMLILFLAGSLSLVLDIHPVKAEPGTIYIHADGSIDPPTANINTSDSITYVFTGNIADSIVVERNNIVVDGAGYALQGPGSGFGFGCSWINNVTIKNTNIENFDYGIALSNSSNNIIFGNTITANNHEGVVLANSSNNIISGNTITANDYEGIILYLSSNNTIAGNDVTANKASEIYLQYSSNNTISGNTIAASEEAGIALLSSSQNNTIYGNTITNNQGGIGVDFALSGSCSYNIIYHNSFVDNTIQVGSLHPSTLNVWDDGYPSGGNYWSNYNGTDMNGDGIGDTSFVIDTNNTDRYPLITPNVWNYSTPIPIRWNGTTYQPSISTNSTVATFNFNQTAKMISFDVTGPIGTTGYCNVTIPKQLLSAPSGLWTVTVGGVQVTPTVTEDDNNTYLRFTYTHSTKTIEIEGTNVVPEFPSPIILLTLNVFTTLAVMLLKRRITKKPNT